MKFKKEEISVLKQRNSIPSDIILNDRQLERLFFKEVVKELFSKNLHPIMHVQENGQEYVWRILIQKKYLKDIIAHIKDGALSKDYHCKIRTRRSSIMFIGTVNNVLFYLYALLNTPQPVEMMVLKQEKDIVYVS